MAYTEFIGLEMPIYHHSFFLNHNSKKEEPVISERENSRPLNLHRCKMYSFFLSKERKYITFSDFLLHKLKNGQQPNEIL